VVGETDDFRDTDQPGKQILSAAKQTRNAFSSQFEGLALAFQEKRLHFSN
jgi:hypothetical protein